jgi:predicted DCC family thiol-disulfide oxidoreductase YuxK
MGLIRSRGVSALLVDQDGPENGWTGGQYSLYRVLLAVTLVAVTSSVAPYFDSQPPGTAHWWVENPEVRRGFQLAFAVLAVPLLVGWFDRVAAAAAGVLALLVSVDLTWILLENFLFAHALSAACPFGSIGALGRVDPGGGWSRSRMNLALASFMTIRALWILPLHWIYPGDVELLAIAMAVPVVVVLARSTLLLRVLAVVLTGLFVLGTVDIFMSPPESEFSIALVLLMATLTLTAFDPALIPGRRSRHPEVVYYDGDCGLCHRTVRFLLAEDQRGNTFRYAALQSDHFADHVKTEERASLGDSVIVRKASGELLQRSSAIVHLLLALGGLWRVIGSLIWCIPRPLRDFGYDVIAKLRKRVFPAPEGLCPLIPPELGARFLG